MTPSGPDAPRRRGAVWPVPAYGVLAVVLTWPLAREAGGVIPTVVGLPDALFQAFLLEWDLRHLRSGLGGVFDVPIFHPETNTLTYMDHLLGPAVIAAPAAWATGNLAFAYDSVVGFSFVVSAWAMYRLTRLLGVSRGGSFVAGTLFAFSPYRWCNMANLNLLQTQFLPLGVFFALRAARAGRARDGIAAGVTLAAQSYFSWYYTFYLATALAAVAVHAAWTRGLGTLLRPALWWSAGTAATLALPGLLPYLRQRLAMPGFGRSLGSAAFWSADVLDYLKANVESRVWSAVPGMTGDQSYAPGLVATVLATIGVIETARRVRSGHAVSGSGAEPAATPGPAPSRGWARWRDRARAWGDTGALLAVTATGFVLSLGPLLRVAGHRLWVPLPYAALFYVVPGFQSMRSPGRYAVLVTLGVSALAGVGYEACRRRLTPGRRRALFAATMAATVALTLSVPWPTIALPRAADLPPVYRWLAELPEPVPVLVLPVPLRESDESQRDITRQFYAVYHRKPLVDGVSGFVSPAHRAFRATLQTFPSGAALEAAAARGTRIVVVHYGDWPDSTRAALRARVARTPSLRERAAFGDDVAYALVP